MGIIIQITGSRCARDSYWPRQGWGWEINRKTEALPEKERDYGLKLL